MRDRHLLHGLIAAAFTPMRPDGSLNTDVVPAVVDFVLGQGAGGLFLCGSTGEGTSLTTEERMAVADAYREAAGGRVPVVSHVGHNCLEDARALAVHAQAIGLDAIAAAPPTYFRPASVGVLADCLARIAEAAPDLPLYYYHIPALTGVSFRMIDLLEISAERIPTLAGVKFSSTQLDDLQRCVDFDGGRSNILFGADEMLLAGLAMGAQGAVGSTYNFLGPIYRRVLESFERGDLSAARQQQLVATRIVHAILSFGRHEAIKAAMSILGVDCGPPRLPMTPLDTAQCRALREAIDLATAGATDSVLRP